MYFCLFNLVFNFDGGSSAAGSNQWNYPSVNDGRVHPFRSPNPIHQSPNPNPPMFHWSFDAGTGTHQIPCSCSQSSLDFLLAHTHTHTWGKSIKKKSFVS